MALSRKMLAGMGLSEEQIVSITEAHSEVVSALQEKAEGYKEKADKYDATKKELDELKEKVANDNSKEELQKVQKEFDKFKKETEAKETKSAKEEARLKLLKDAGIPEKWIARAKNSISIDDLELEDGKLKDSKAHLKKIKEEWADVIGTIKEKGADTTTPPTNTGGKGTMTKEQIRQIKNPIERQRKMLENPQLFGLGKGE